MKLKLLRTSLLAGAGVLLANSFVLMPASAAVVVTNTTQGTAFNVLAGDLLEASGTTHVNTVTSTAVVITDTDARFSFSDGTDTGSFVGVPSVTNGSFGAMPTGPKNRAEFIGVTGDATITYSFDLITSPTGYDIGQIGIYSAWNNTGRDNINVNILYATVAAPTTYISLTSATNNAPGYPNLTPVANLSSVTDTTGVLATGVSSLRFVFPGQENGGVGYREIDVSVVPEPNSALMLLGGLGMFLGVHRSRAHRA